MMSGLSSYWALELECRILMFMWFVGSLVEGEECRSVILRDVGGLSHHTRGVDYIAAI